MRIAEWSRTNADYGRKLFNSGLEGARSGREAFLHGGSFAPFLGESVRRALKPAALGVCLGLFFPREHRKFSRGFVCGIVGGTIGFALGVGWQTRRLAATMTSAALGSMEKVRDEHWLEKNPIDYA